MWFNVAILQNSIIFTPQSSHLRENENLINIEFIINVNFHCRTLIDLAIIQMSRLKNPNIQRY